MRGIYRAILLTGLVVFAPALTACSSGSDFDLDKLDVFGINEKKKLPGERKDVFPGGVPGVTQGIPPEYMRGNQPATAAAQPSPAEQNKAAAAASDQDSDATTAEPEQKPKPKRAAAKPRTSAPPAQQAGQPATWPEPVQQQPQQNSQSAWPAPQGQTNTASPWPSSPQPGTFSR